MGGMQSTAATASSSSADPRGSTDRKLFSTLYQDLKSTASTTAADPSTTNGGEFMRRFVHYFGGPCPRLGELLYHKLFGSGHVTDLETFSSKMSDFKNILSTESDDGLHKVEKFYFSVFAQDKQTLDINGLKEVIRISCTMALMVGTELHDKAVLVPSDSPVIQSLATSAMPLTNQETHEVSEVQFVVWLKEHCPKLLQGVTFWMRSILSPSEQSTDSNTASYSLPSPEIDGQEISEDDKIALYVLIWSLSTITPLIYMGHRVNESAIEAANRHPVGGAWTRLYSSSSNGLSMNRLQSHCFDYREPSLMIITTTSNSEASGQGRNGVEGGEERGRQESKFIIGVDKEWRDGTFFWGEKDCFLLELQPSFTLLKSGAKLISLNEKQRGFPTGLRFMADESHRSVLLEIDSSLEKGQRNGLDLNLVKIEVWGCGGFEAINAQKKVKEWQQKEVLRRQRINKDELRENWANSPDRYILELGGVKVNHPQEQQQQ